MRTRARVLLMAVGLFLLAPGTKATVEMQNQARKLGFTVKNCLYCHASPHSEEVMKAKARELGVPAGNCLGCHGANIPASLNRRGDWLLAEKKTRGAKAFDMAWLKDYKEPTPEPKPTPTPPPKDLIKVQSNP